MPDMNRKIFDWSKVKSWVNDTFSLNTHDHDDRYSKLGHTHDDTIYSSMPDFSRAMSLGAQEGWKVTDEECYKESGTNGTVLGGCPYVLKCINPCYLFLTHNGTSVDDDAEWAIWWGTTRNHVICCNKAQDYAYKSVISRLTSDNGYSTLQFGVNFFVITHDAGGGDEMANHVFPMSNRGWWYRPMIGGGGSDNENWEYWDYVLVPCLGTPKGTILAERYQFVATNGVSSLLNSNPRYGTMDGDTNVITYYNKNGVTNATATIVRRAPGIYRAK